MIITITSVLFIVGLLFFGSLPFISIYEKRKKEKLCRQLSKEGANQNLIFCSQEILENKVIGFDGIHRKILVLEKNKNKYTSSVISLDEVLHCQLLTDEGIIEPRDFKKLGQQIKTGILELQFEFSNQHEAASIIFNNGLMKSKREFDLLKAKAEYWCVMFSKMSSQQMSARA
ncbi:MAG: hypothetical protein ABI374_09210 [Ginsengibacter sp.]